MPEDGRNDFVAHMNRYLGYQFTWQDRPEISTLKPTVVVIFAGHSGNRKLASLWLMRIQEQILLSHFSEESKASFGCLLAGVEALAFLALRVDLSQIVMIELRPSDPCAPMAKLIEHALDRAASPFVSGFNNPHLTEFLTHIALP